MRWLRSMVLILLVLAAATAQAEPEQADAVGGGAAASMPTASKKLKEYLFGSVEWGATEFAWETDLYYSNISLNIPLTDEPIRKLADADELEIYSKLFVDSLIPRYMLVEAAVMPMPLVGVATKEYANHFYNQAKIGRNQNVISWITAGFEEPWAASIFFGEVVNFQKQGEDKLSSNKGYMGYLVSYSNQHIKSNSLIRDNSFEVEWKLKGERSFRDDKLSWSFRLGSKIHDHPNIANTFYVGLRRSNLDFKVNPFEFLKNSTIDFRWDVALKSGALVRQEYVLGKSFPIKSWGVALKLDAGFIWEDPSRYTGPLHDSNFRNFTVVLRPNIVF